MILTVNHKDLFRFVPEGIDPGKQTIFIRVSADSVQTADPCLYLDHFAEEPYRLGTLQQ